MQLFWLILLFAGAVYAQNRDTATPFQNFDDRYHYYLHRTYGWQRLTFLGADTAIDYATGGAADLGRGLTGYGSRYGFTFGQRVVQNTLELGFSTVLREDARFRPSDLKGVRKRTWYAVSHAFTATSPEGGTKVAWSRLLSTVAATVIASGWKPRAVTGGYLAGNISSGMTSHIQNSLLTEFSPDLKQFGIGLRKKILGR